MAAHRYWRVTILKYSRLGVPQVPWLAEIELRETIGGSHSAISATYSASVNTATAIDAFNGNTADGWFGNDTSVPQNIDILFATAVDVAELSLHSAGQASNTLTDFKLEHSDDGTIWIEDVSEVNQDLGAVQAYSVGTPSVTGTLGLTFDNQIEFSSGTLGLQFENKLSNNGALGITFDNQLFDSSGTLGIQFENKLSNSGTLGLIFENQIYINEVSNSRVFSVFISLNDIDISAKITNDISIDGNESIARLAVFDMLPVAGIIDPYDWIGKDVIIDYIENGQRTRLYTGIVHLPIFDTNTGITRFKCTDALQETVELTTREIVDGIIGGWWDAAVFNAKDNWTYALQRIGTIPASYDMDVFRKPRITNWQPKAAADYSFTAIIDKSGKFDFAERRNIINSIQLKFDVRFNRLWSKVYSGIWKSVDFETWLSKPFGLPAKQMILDSLSNFEVLSFATTGLKTTGNYINIGGLGNTVIWLLTEFGKTLALSASFRIRRKWTQSINKTHNITLQAPASIDKHGLLQVDKSASISIENGKDWESDNPLARAGEVVINPDVSIFNEGIDYENAIATVINEQATKLLSSHRQNKYTFDLPLQPQIDMNNTVAITIDRVDVKGKVKSIKHLISPKSGKAISTITLALYRPNVAAQISDPLTVDSQIPTPVVNSSALLDLKTYIGTDFLLPEDDENWTGWVSNFEKKITQQSSIAKNVEKYDERWAQDEPEIPDSEVKNENIVQQDVINIGIPQDISTIEQI